MLQIIHESIASDTSMCLILRRCRKEGSKMKYEFIQESSNPTIVKVIGVGGAGGNAVDRMIEVGIRDVEYIAANTDLQDLEKKRAQLRRPLRM